MRCELLIPQNVAPEGVRKIRIYNNKDKKILDIITFENLALPRDRGEKLYSFGALSDVHIVYDTAADDFARALSFFDKREDIAFTCICGDLTDDGTDEELAAYKAVVDAYAGNTPVYAISGNHEASTRAVSTAVIQPYTGQPLYYSFVYGDDVYIMCGQWTWSGEGLFIAGELQWLYEVLEANRNKRCFVFFHVFPWGDSGNANGLYTSDAFSSKAGSVFQSLMKHYKNTVFFHGHSHLKFYLQEVDDKANYSEAMGYRSIHIPSLAVPRDVVDGTLSYIYADSEGYVVDVYKNGIHLRGRDFVQEKYLPIASYWIDTALVEVEANTYTDDTGTIDTTSTNGSNAETLDSSKEEC